jgi:hypothetical protein
MDFKVAENTRRDWYHAIWMQQGKSGREFVHGLTEERASRSGQYASNVKPGEVFDPQTKFLGSTVLVSASAVDYSLQMQTGLEHLCGAASKGEKPFDTEPAPVVCMLSAHTTTLQPFGRPDVAAQKRELESVDWTSYEDPIR